MAIEIHETFQIAAPVERVWDFMMTPENVIACMPGASLTEIVDSTHFVAAVKVRIGAVTAQYQGKVTYVEADRGHYRVRLLAEGNERGGGTVHATIDTRLASLPDVTATEVQCESIVDLTGRIVQVGRGMIEGVAAQIIRKYVANVKAMLEPQGDAGGAVAAASSSPPSGAAAPPVAPVPPTARAPPREESINAVGLVLRVLWDRLVAALRRLFGRS